MSANRLVSSLEYTLPTFGSQKELNQPEQFKCGTET